MKEKIGWKLPLWPIFRVWIHICCRGFFFLIKAPPFFSGQQWKGREFGFQVPHKGGWHSRISFGNAIHLKQFDSVGGFKISLVLTCDLSSLQSSFSWYWEAVSSSTIDHLFLVNRVCLVSNNTLHAFLFFYLRIGFFFFVGISRIFVWKIHKFSYRVEFLDAPYAWVSKNSIKMQREWNF